MAASSYESKFVFVHWDSKTQTLTLQWKRPAQYQCFKDGLEAALKSAEKHHAERLILDNSILNLQEEDDAFFLKQWIPQAAKRGIRRLALVIERRHLVQIPKSRRQQRLKSGALVLHYFDDMDAAHLWIKEAAAA